MLIRGSISYIVYCADVEVFSCDVEVTLSLKGYCLQVYLCRELCICD